MIKDEESRSPKGTRGTAKYKNQYYCNTKSRICQIEGEMIMKQAYKMALQILLKMAERERTYIKVEDVKLICEMALIGDEEECSNQDLD